jgi:hypothetical protein
MRPKTIVLVALFGVALGAIASPGASAERSVKLVRSQGADPLGVKNQGVGTYTDASVANQISNFSINPRMVSCGVGTIATSGWTGPFAMLMYAQDIRSYKVDAKASMIQAKGAMRSITAVAGNTMEDVTHKFLAIAVDGKAAGPDRFDVHFRTDFWNTANPMCSPSSIVSGGCRFGGEVLLGGVAVGP